MTMHFEQPVQRDKNSVHVTISSKMSDGYKLEQAGSNVYLPDGAEYAFQIRDSQPEHGKFRMVVSIDGKKLQPIIADGAYNELTCFPDTGKAFKFVKRTDSNDVFYGVDYATGKVTVALFREIRQQQPRYDHSLNTPYQSFSGVTKSVSGGFPGEVSRGGTLGGRTAQGNRTGQEFGIGHGTFELAPFKVFEFTMKLDPRFPSPSAAFGKQCEVCGTLNSKEATNCWKCSSTLRP